MRSGFAFSLEELEPLRLLPGMARAGRVGSTEEKMAKMRNPELRAAAVYATDNADNNFKALMNGLGGHPRRLVLQWVDNHEELEKHVGKTLAQIGMEENKHPVEAMLDLSLETNLKAEFLGPDRGFNADFMAEIFHPPRSYTFPGVSGRRRAHQVLHRRLLHYRFPPLDVVRDTQKLTLEEAHYRMSALPAHAAGFRDRGMLREGLAADIVVYDLKGLDIEPDWVGEIVHDLLRVARLAPRAALQGLPYRPL